MAYGGLPFADDGNPIPGFYVYNVSDMINDRGTVSTCIHLPRKFLFTDILFINGLDNI